MAILASAMKALDAQNALTWAAKGLKHKQFYDVFAAYARGAQLPKAGAHLGTAAFSQLSGLKSQPLVGAARMGVLGFGALATWNMLPRNNTLAIPGAVGAGAAAAYGMGRIPHIAGGGRWSGGLRAAGGLLAGSLVYQGLRAAGPEEYKVSM